MARKTCILILALALCAPAAAFSAQDYAAELKQQQKKLAELNKQINAQKEKINQLASEYEQADMQLRLELSKDKQIMGEKEYIRKAKQEQEKLRNDYFAKKTPLKTEYNKLKSAHHKCRIRIKKLTKKIDRISDDPYAEKYKEQIDRLNDELSQRRQVRDKAIEEIRENADRQIAAITDMSNKSSIKKQILSEAKDKELALRKEYTADKDAIAKKKDEARAEYKQNIEAWRARKAAEKKAEKLKDIERQKEKLESMPAVSDDGKVYRAQTNFSPAN